MAFDKLYYSTDGYSDYQALAAEQSQLVYNYISQTVSINPRWKFLDLGCGYGYQLEFLRRHGFEAWGTEISDFCLQESPYRKWMKRASVTQIPFPDLSFDITIAFSVLYYLTPPEITQALSEIYRVTKVGVYLDCITSESPNSDQKLNPDNMRKQENLLASKDWESLLFQSGFYRLKPPEGESYTLDFHGLFLKKST